MSELNILNNEPIKLTYLHIHQTTPNCGTQYAQDIEPTGEYMTYNDHKYKIELSNYEYGTITFNNPLVIEFISTTHGGWKTTLLNMFNGKKKKALSNAIIKAGYDAIITIDSDMQEIKEIVNLKGIKASNKF